ncbi:uncharacterized protein Z518_08936 [Rhinocladiella mackenziei CBS 650.93]|uniref:Chromo domain-containing protein n=1 Tax=Rhinocladiella mackenziei CBS 650.93 TaxID=1442369 RepID=A0A0D2IDA5_9EURO|nr:uncharacterized protein Z518_08936 [Rhinocladiella mackenziei CBS 650.93]KIX01211.1 hypothetical protein Z518_08936 [Rhinocladiella mackenziei CBS 650.93]
MTTFIAYQPQKNAPSFRGRTFSKSSAVGLPCSASSGQSTRSPQQATSVNNADFVDFVDLTAPRLDAAREYLVARDILEPMNHDSEESSIHAYRARSSGATDNEKSDHGEKGDREDDGIDCESETSDLPSPRDLCAWKGKQFGRRNVLNLKASASPASVIRTSEERGSEDVSEDSVNPDNPPDNPLATTVGGACGTRLGTSQDNPIVLDDDQQIDTHDALASNDEKPAFEVASPTTSSDPSLKLYGGGAERGMDDGKSIPDGTAQGDKDDRASDEEEGGGTKPHEDDALHTHTLAANGNGGIECCGSGTGSDTPASVGRIHDVFAEYEETFGLPKSKQKVARSTVHDCPESGTIAGSLSRPVSHGEPRVSADDDVAKIEQAAEAAGGDAARLSKREIENGSTSRSRQESNEQETEIVQVRSQCVATLAGGCHSQSAFQRGPPTPTSMTTKEAIRSNASAVTQGGRIRKRSWSPTPPTVLPDDGVPQKRPRRATKETWKAREAREAREAQRSQTSLGPYRKEQALFVGLDSARGEVDHRVADIEDVYLGEDGSIQCIVKWKSSLISLENVVGRELQ